MELTDLEGQFWWRWQLFRGVQVRREGLTTRVNLEFSQREAEIGQVVVNVD